MKLLCRDESCSVYQMKNETGDGTATYYEVYPGMGVIYNDFHMTSCPPRRFDNTHNISIHHCREGRIEWEVSNGAYDLLINNELVAEAFASLPEQEQSILILHCVLEMADGEIGSLMGMSRSAVQRHRTSTLKQLRVKLMALMPGGR